MSQTPDPAEASSRTESSATTFNIRAVAIIGAGPAGRAFAFRAAAAGFRVALEDVMPSNLRRAQDEFAEYVESANPGGAPSGSLRYASTVEDAVHDADLALDFVPDELESKLEIFSLLDRMAPPRTILCTPTLALSLTDLASCTYRSERCVALRSSASALGDLLRSAGALSQPSADGQLAPNLEVVYSRFSDSSAAPAVVDFLAALGLRSTIVPDPEEPMLVKNLPVENLLPSR